jgi:hypothetical protein
MGERSMPEIRLLQFRREEMRGFRYRPHCCCVMATMNTALLMRASRQF